jgi:hypothetical protein
MSNGIPELSHEREQVVIGRISKSHGHWIGGYMTRTARNRALPSATR